MNDLYPIKHLPVLLDANVIIESHRINAWKTLSSYFKLESVGECITEAKNVRRKFQSKMPINGDDLRRALSFIGAADSKKYADLVVGSDNIQLGSGEKALWAYALGWEGNWLFCGPDKASLRCGIKLGFRDQIISLETLLISAGYPNINNLKKNYREKWHQDFLKAMNSPG